MAVLTVLQPDHAEHGKLQDPLAGDLPGSILQFCSSGASAALRVSAATKGCGSQMR